MSFIKLCYLSFLFCLTALVTAAQEKEGIKAEGSHQAEYNADAQDREHTGEIDSRVQPSEDREGPPANAGQQNNLGPTPTGSRTTSPGGSPGVLMEDDEITDGTNTRQSAEPNIAGSPVPGGALNNTRADENADVPDNKVFSGDIQKEVPGTVYGVKSGPRSKDNDAVDDSD